MPMTTPMVTDRHAVSYITIKLVSYIQQNKKMSQSQTHDEVAPLCDSCGRSLSPRDDNQWFCAGCIEYGRYTGTIKPFEPDHPQFYRDLDGDLERKRELLVGQNIEYAPYASRELEHVGRITNIEKTGDSPQQLTVFIERTRDFPFDRTVNEIELDRFLELLHEPEPPAHRDTIEEKAAVLVIV